MYILLRILVAESPPLVVMRICNNIDNKENRETSVEDETPAVSSGFSHFSALT